LSETSRSGRGLFAIGSDVYGWDDVVRLAKLRGDWSALAADVQRGRAALSELEARGEAIGDAEIAAAAREFRYARDLIAADELDAWLDRHELSADDWHAYLRRALARARLPEAAARAPAGDDDEAAVWCEGICSGRLERVARDLARLVAVSPGAPVDQLDEAFDRFCAGASDGAAEAHEVETNRLEWLRFAYEAVVAADEGAAYEAVLCVRADGDSLGQVAGRAGLELEQDECWLDELEPALATRFLAATPGELVGPVPVEDGFVVAHVLTKTAPSLADEDVRVRAHEAAVDRVVSRLVADRVVWL
jgi:hypothetical protein